MSDVDKREECPGGGDFTTPVKSESHRKHVPFSPSARSCGTPREEELSNSLMNLKLGFKQRLVDKDDRTCNDSNFSHGDFQGRTTSASTCDSQRSNI